MRWWDQRLSGPLYCRMDASFQILTQSATGRDLCNTGDAGGAPACSQAVFLGLLITGVPLCGCSQWPAPRTPFLHCSLPPFL